MAVGGEHIANTLRIALLLLLLASGSCYEVGTVTTRVLFGGGPNCTSSCNPGYTYANSYACSDDKGNWNAGVGYFIDPIPPNKGYVMHSYNATVYGSYCTNVTVLILLGDLWTEVDIPASEDCSCSNCVSGQAIPQSDTRADGMISYNYQASNQFQIGGLPMTSVLCVSAVDVTLLYGPVSYNVTSLSPSTGSGVGNITMYVFGGKFYASSELSCKFDATIRVQATLVNETTLACVIPPSNSLVFPYNATVEVSEDGIAYTANGITFEYTGLPRPVVPPQHLAWWFWVTIAVCVLSVLCVAIAGYFYSKRHRARGDYSLIDENSRLINSDKFKQFGTVQPVDISEVTIQQRIGRGSCAEVFTGTWRGTTVAIKKAKVYADDDEEFFMELAQEAAIMSELRHPNVLQFLGTASNPPEIVIIMEFMARGSLYRIIHDQTIDLSWSRIKAMALDIARGMNYLHCSDPIIIHRDLKSHNLLVDEHFKVKVCDFGLSTVVKRRLDRITAMTPVGTPCWTAPEVLRNEVYTERADVLWELVTREDPYQGMPTFQIVIAVGQHKMRPLIPATTTIPSSFSQLMSDCWNEDPNLRPPFSDIVSRLEKM